MAKCYGKIGQNVVEKMAQHYGNVWLLFSQFMMRTPDVFPQDTDDILELDVCPSTTTTTMKFWQERKSGCWAVLCWISVMTYVISIYFQCVKVNEATMI